MSKRMRSPEDTQQMVVEAIQNDIPDSEIRRVTGASAADITAWCNAVRGMTQEQFAAVVRLMKVHDVEGWS